MGNMADAYERERRMVDLGSQLPESASGLVSGSLGREGHFSYYRFEAFEGEGLRLSNNNPVFMWGWRKAANGDPREARGAEGWDAFAERYPQVVNRWDPWAEWDDDAVRGARVEDYNERLRREAAHKGER